ncbi:polysaccharide deacetylase family protein [Meiothermus rufus]|uniref:polysaccharide deacetylase family protein n=1 Tax=Meiothermus rufus TaxID=604332 RepID=UPI000413B2C1|nr:polysaccharide deacetylase family protein [Meiothermus rufus]
METLVEILTGIALLYGLAWVLGSWMGLGSLAWGSRAQPQIALTFDDGPSPKTEALLALLDRYGVRATFFLTGQRAEQYPHLVEKIRQAGHQIEAHGYWHRPAILMAPWTEWVQIARSPGRLYRPPWGIVSPFTYWFARWQGKQVALWDLESKDWLEQPPEALVKRMLFYVKGGSVLLLHDGPERTLAILEQLLPLLLQNGYQPVRMDELELAPLGPRQALIRASQGAEERYDQQKGCLRVSFRYDHILRLELQSYPGPALPGFPPGTPCAQIHLESARIAELSTMQVIRAFRQTFAEVARFLEAHPEVQFLYGYSYLGPAAKTLGFQTHPLPPLAALESKLSTAWFTWLYRGQVARHLFSNPAEILYITRETILSRYKPLKNGS